MRQEDPVHGLFELGTGSEALDTVVAKGSCQIRPESLRQVLLVRVEGVQIGVEVLPRAMDPLVRSLLLADWPAARQFTQVGEHRDQCELFAAEFRVVRPELAPQLEVLADQRACPLRAHVVAGDHCS